MSPMGTKYAPFANVVEIARRCAEFPVVAAPAQGQTAAPAPSNEG